MLIRDPKILLMDEPFGPLDAQTRQIMGNLLLDLWAADRKAVMFVTHDLEEAIALADRVVSCRRGRRRASSATIASTCRARATSPRSGSNPRFHALHRAIWASLRDEVQKAYAQTAEAVPHEPAAACSSCRSLVADRPPRCLACAHSVPIVGATC